MIWFVPAILVAIAMLLFLIFVILAGKKGEMHMVNVVFNDPNILNDDVRDFISDYRLSSTTETRDGQLKPTGMVLSDFHCYRLNKHRNVVGKCITKKRENTLADL